jgi:hypothetical protein
MTRDDNYTPFTGRHREPPVPVLVEMLWRLIGPSGTQIVCGVYRTEAGLELRGHYADSIDALIRSELVSHIDIARDTADKWKQAAIDKGFTKISRSGIQPRVADSEPADE